MTLLVKYADNRSYICGGYQTGKVQIWEVNSEQMMNG